MHKHRFGIFSWFGYPVQPVERIGLIQQAGFNSTSIWLHDSSARAFQYAELLLTGIKEHNMFCDYLHAPYFRCNSVWREDEGQKTQLLADYKAYLDYCAMNSIPVMVVHTVKGVNPPGVSVQGADFYRELANYGETKRVKVALENTKHPEYIDYLLSRIDSPSLGFCYDSSHDFLYGEKPGDILSKWGHRLMATHLAGNDGSQDNHLLPNADYHTWVPVIEAFPDTYDGPLTLEVVKDKADPRDVNKFLTDGFNFLDFFDCQVNTRRSSISCGIGKSSRSGSCS